MNLLRGFVCDQNGTTAIQYALVAGVVCLAVLTGSLALRGSIVDLYDVMADEANVALGDEAAGEPLPED